LGIPHASKQSKQDHLILFIDNLDHGVVLYKKVSLQSVL